MSTNEEELSARIEQLEAENDELQSQLAELAASQATSCKNTTTIADSIDPEVLNYLEAHGDVLTLDFLEKAYATLAELKASDPEKDLYDYIEELKHAHANYATELAELKIAKKEAEIKYQLMKRRYEEELNSFNELKIEHLFKNSGAKEYVKQIKEKNKVKEEAMSHLKRELEQKKNELAKCQDKLIEAQKQCEHYWRAWEETQMKKEQLEAERMSIKERERRVLTQSINHSSASSLIDNQVPPPPPVEIPSIEDARRQVFALGKPR